MSQRPDPPIVLLSGMAADDRIFAPQRAAFPTLYTPAWIKPRPVESIADYAARFAADLPNQRDTILGGVSFGGIVALEMARHLEPAAVVLIGSVRRPEELPRWVRRLRPIAPALRAAPLVGVQAAAWTAATGVRPLGLHRFAAVLQQVAATDRGLLRWSMRRITQWSEDPVLPCPLHHLHGSDDPVLPAARTQPDRTIEGGGHLITLSHPKQVNAWLREIVDQPPKTTR